MIKKTRNDIILICTIIAVALVTMLIISSMRSDNGTFIVVRLGTKEIARYSLDEDREVRIDSGDDGYNILVIEDGKAFVKEANCRTQRCVRSPKISHTYEFIRCAPHDLNITVEEG